LNARWVHADTQSRAQDRAGSQCSDDGTTQALSNKAYPYASWERGTNSLIRQYFPQHRDFTTITRQEIDMAMERLNTWPRKRLGYLTSDQVFFKLGVALHT
jgi:IS30 family transposase